MFDDLRKGADKVMLRVAAARKSLVGTVTRAVGEERMAGEAEQARAASDRLRADLQAQAVGLFAGYYVAVGNGVAGEERAALRRQVERALQSSIRSAYREQFRLGKRYGWNWSDLDAAEEKWLERLRRDEYVFVRRFLDDIERGSLGMSVEQRAGLYGKASSEAFWAGYLYADQSSGRYVKWQMHEVEESCPDCRYLSGSMEPDELAEYENPNDLPPGGRFGNGVYEVQELARLGIHPQGGELRCTTNCRCELAEAQRPRRAPEGPMQQRPFVSLAPKPVEEPYASKRQGKRTKRVQRSGKVERGKRLQKAIETLIAGDLFGRRG